MRDSRSSEYMLSDQEVFSQFKINLERVMKENGFELKFSFRDRVGILYKGGFLEVYDYDRPRNPRFEDGKLVIDWPLVGELRSIAIELK